MKSKGIYTVKVNIGDVEVVVEGAESGVVKIVEALSGMLQGDRSTRAVFDTSALRMISATPRTSPIDIRSFFAEKKPSSDVEATAVATYFYQYLAPDSQRHDYVDSKLLQEAFRHAKRPLPAKTAYTLQNARGAGYLDSTGDGKFKLTPVGYNLVEHSLGSEDNEKKPPRHRSRK